MSFRSDSPFLDDELNPYSAPRAELKPTPVDLDMVSGAERIRLAHIRHEASVRSIGSLYYVAFVLNALSTLVSAVQLMSGPPPGQVDLGTPFQAVILIVNIALTALCGALGYGLRRLLVWARWTAVAHVSLALFVVLCLGGLMLLVSLSPVAVVVAMMAAIPAYVLYLLLAPKAGVIFSPDYKRVIALTPGVVYQSSLILKVFLVVVVVGIVVVFIAALSR